MHFSIHTKLSPQLLGCRQTKIEVNEHWKKHSERSLLPRKFASSSKVKASPTLNAMIDYWFHPQQSCFYLSPGGAPSGGLYLFATESSSVLVVVVVVVGDCWQLETMKMIAGIGFDVSVKAESSC